MRHLFKTLPFLWICFSVVTQAKAQDLFSGSILFDLTYEGDMVEMFSAMMPSTYALNFHESSMSFEMSGGMAAMLGGTRFITDNTKGVTYMLNDKEKVAYEIKHDSYQKQMNKETLSKSEIKKLEEQLEIAGYQCQKYEVVMKGEEGSTATQYMWVTSELQVTQPGQYNIGNMPNSFINSEEIDGFPLKIISEIASQGVSFTMTMTASEVTAKTFSNSDFTIPKGYEVKPFDAFKY